MKSSQFLSIDYNLLASDKLSLQQKIIISYVISWQNSNKECTASNEYLSSTLGLTPKQVEYAITKLNKYSFFSSTKVSTGTKAGNFFNSKIMKVDEEQLKIFLSTKEEKIEQPVLETSTGENESITDDSTDIISNEGDDTTQGEIIDSTPISSFVVEDYINELTKNKNEIDKKKIIDALYWYMPMLNARRNEPDFCKRHINGVLISYKLL